MQRINTFPTMSPINKTNIMQVEQAKTNIEENSKKDNGLSSNAAEALKAQVLYQKSKNDIIYLDDNLSKKEIILALKDKNKMGRSFFGFKRTVANIISRAEDKKLATKNFNILMNFEDEKLNANDITAILMVATSINNKKMDEKFVSEYGFSGGILDKKTINSIFNKIKEQRELQQFALMQQQMMNNKLVQQQIFQQQMVQQQMMINQQHVMMTTPGMGFC